MEQDERYAEQVLALVTRDNLSLYSSCSDDYDSYPKGVMVETFDHHRDQEQESILCLNDKYPFFENTIQDWEGKRSHLIFRLFHLLLARTKKRHSIRNLILVIELERKERLEFKQFYFSDMALLKESRSTTAHLYNSLRHYGFRFGFQAVNNGGYLKVIVTDGTRCVARAEPKNSVPKFKNEFQWSDQEFAARINCIVALLDCN